MEKIGIILASVREGRRGEGFAKWIHELTARREGVEAELVDLKDWPVQPYTSKAMPSVAEANYPEGSVEQRWASLVNSHDAFIVVTPEYSHGYPGQLKNAIDALFKAWAHKPIAFVTYGGFASGARAAEQLSSVAIELRMVPIRDQVNVRLIGLVADERGAPTEELYQKRAALMLDELVWFSKVLREARAARAK